MFFICVRLCVCWEGGGRSGFEMQILTEDCYESRQAFSAAAQQSVFVCSVFVNNMFSSGPVYPFNITKTSQKPKGHFSFYFPSKKFYFDRILDIQVSFCCDSRFVFLHLDMVRSSFFFSFFLSLASATSISGGFIIIVISNVRFVAHQQRHEEFHLPV